MNNIEFEVTDNILTAKIDLDKRFGPSPSLKTIQVASSQGNVKVPGFPEIKIGINAFVKNPDYKEEDK